MCTTIPEAIMNRRSNRSYTGKVLSQDNVMELLKAARLAPSSLNSQPWRFKVLTERSDLSWLAGAASRHQAWLADAGCVFLCCADVGAYIADSVSAVQIYAETGLPKEMLEGIQAYVEHEKTMPRSEQVLAASINTALAIGNMMLMATSLELGSCWVGMFDREALREKFGLQPSLHVVSLLAVGEPEDETGPQLRKPLDEIVIP